MISQFSLCPLCGSRGEHFYYYSRQKRDFYLCPLCRLLYQETSSLPDEEEERARYSLHRNSEEDKGYVEWLERFISRAVLPWFRGGSILDFGSGPEPVLSRLLAGQGRDVYSYDKYFSPSWPGDRTFSFVILSEVLEHLADPLKEFRRIASLTEKNGRIVLQTSFLRFFNKEWFGSWWYKEDVTHIRFYSASSLIMLGQQSGWTLEYQDGRSIAVFKKNTQD